MLNKARGFVRADRKSLPIDDRARAVGDVKRTALCRKGGLAFNHDWLRTIGVDVACSKNAYERRDNSKTYEQFRKFNREALWGSRKTFHILLW